MSSACLIASGNGTGVRDLMAQVRITPKKCKLSNEGCLISILFFNREPITVNRERLLKNKDQQQEHKDKGQGQGARGVRTEDRSQKPDDLSSSWRKVESHEKITVNFTSPDGAGNWGAVYP